MGNSRQKMAARTTTQPFSIDEFTSEKVNYRSNNDLCHNLKHGDNKGIGGGTAEGVVLVMLNMDHEPIINVEVSNLCPLAGEGPSLSDADTIDAAIESLILVRDTLRKLELAAA
jgi:hypothetical protein